MFFLIIPLLLIVSVKSSAENDTIVFRSGEAGYFCLRIPSLLTTARGTLLALGEGRMYSCNDDTEKDIVYKRSVDNGKTWSTLQVLYRGNASNDGYNGVGNFAPIQLKYNQRILVPFCKNNAVFMQSYSDDDGLTFSHPEVIYNVTKPDWTRIYLGPPGGLLLQSNRILIPGYYRKNTTVYNPFYSGFVILNDNNGQVDKWYLGGEFNLEPYLATESQAVELLPNVNSIFINIRSYGRVRLGAHSNDGGLTFNKMNVLNNLTQPLHGCEGSMIFHQNSHQLLFTGLADTSTDRTNLSMYMSKDNGEHWMFVKTIWKGPSAYSSLTTLKDQSIGVLYEAGNSNHFPSFYADFLMFTIVEI